MGCVCLGRSLMEELFCFPSDLSFDLLLWEAGLQWAACVLAVLYWRSCFASPLILALIYCYGKLVCSGLRVSWPFFIGGAVLLPL